VGWAKELPVTQRLLWWWISTGRPGYLTRLRCYATRFTSSSVTSSSIWAASARIVRCGPDQPCDRGRYFSVGDCIGRFSSCFDDGQPYWRDRSRKPYDRWLGFHVAPSRDFLVRLVADS